VNVIKPYSYIYELNKKIYDDVRCERQMNRRSTVESMRVGAAIYNHGIGPVNYDHVNRMFLNVPEAACLSADFGVVELVPWWPGDPGICIGFDPWMVTFALLLYKKLSTKTT
jgi:hypothetical protein